MRNVFLAAATAAALGSQAAATTVESFATGGGWNFDFTNCATCRDDLLNGTLAVLGGGVVSALASVDGVGGDRVFEEGFLEVTNNGPQPVSFVAFTTAEARVSISKTFGETPGTGGARIAFFLDGAPLDGYQQVTTLADGPYFPDFGDVVYTQCLLPGDTCRRLAGDYFGVYAPISLAAGQSSRVSYSALAVAVVPVPLPATAPLFGGLLALAAFAGFRRR